LDGASDVVSANHARSGVHCPHFRRDRSGKTIVGWNQFIGTVRCRKEPSQHGFSACPYDNGPTHFNDAIEVREQGQIV
jgi:hypothetical protein